LAVTQHGGEVGAHHAADVGANLGFAAEVGAAEDDARADVGGMHGASHSGTGMETDAFEGHGGLQGVLLSVAMGLGGFHPEPCYRKAGANSRKMTPFLEMLRFRRVNK
jgi:hypothetical protein